VLRLRKRIPISPSSATTAVPGIDRKSRKLGGPWANSSGRMAAMNATTRQKALRMPYATRLLLDFGLTRHVLAP
jgi:hypothetical protein